MYDVALFTAPLSSASDTAAYHSRCIPYMRLLRCETIVIHGQGVFTVSAYIWGFE